MSLWQDQVELDAQSVDKLLREEYQAGRRTPLSIAALASKLSRPRERIAAALVTLVSTRECVGVVGSTANGSRFYPLDA